MCTEDVFSGGDCCTIEVVLRGYEKSSAKCIREYFRKTSNQLQVRTNTEHG